MLMLEPYVVQSRTRDRRYTPEKGKWSIITVRASKEMERNKDWLDAMWFTDAQSSIYNRWTAYLMGQTNMSTMFSSSTNSSGWRPELTALLRGRNNSGTGRRRVLHPRSRRETAPINKDDTPGQVCAVGFFCHPFVFV